MRKRRKPEEALPTVRREKGEAIAYVPVALRACDDGEQKYARLLKSDYDYICSLGVSRLWADTGCGVVSRVNFVQVNVARMILELEPTYRVTYKDGNHLNLHRSNLSFRRGWSKRDHVSEATEVTRKKAEKVARIAIEQESSITAEEFASLLRKSGHNIGDSGLVPES